MSDPRQDCMPDCMSPDGAEPCAGYTALLNRIKELEAENEQIREWAWRLHEDLKHYQCAGDGCNGCPVCLIPDAACDKKQENDDD